MVHGITNLLAFLRPKKSAFCKAILAIASAACEAVQREGGEVVARPVDQFGILVARAADPDGNRFWLAQVSRS